MKKIIISALAVFGCAFCAIAKAGDTQYKVYDVVMSLRTTKAAGSVATSCGDTYVYRDRGSRKIYGVIAGCGCIAMAGDPSCSNFQMYFWDVSTKTQLTNYTFKTELLQRIGKTGAQVEQVVTFTVEDQYGEKFKLQLAGFGSYRASSTDKAYDTIAVNGYVTGTVDAPYRLTRGSCSACSETPDSLDQTEAVAVCEDGVCTPSSTSDTTPAFGTYSMKYNVAKSIRAERNGVTPQTLGLPLYVNAN